MNVVKLKDIADLLHGRVVGDADIEIFHVAKIEEAGNGDITFLANPKYEKYLSTTKASAVVVSADLDEKKLNGRGRQIAFVEVDDPYVSFLQLLKALEPAEDFSFAGVHPTAVVAASAKLGANVAIGAHVVVGERVRVGENSKISHGSVVGDDVVLGSDVRIYPNVTLREKCRIGDRVIIHPGAVIGSDGFGFAPDKDGVYKKIPQVGTVVIEDDVEIGANCTIDRATMGETLIKRGVKLDNLVHVAHNVVIGEGTMIAAQAGIAGSTKVGRRVLMGGQVGIIGHVEIADNVAIIAQSGVSKSLTKPGATYFGAPAKEQRVAFRIEAALRHLPELLEEVKRLREKIESLERQLKTKEP
jgi:UDP-3-O-[3-hydroxymyristoyl] glucosamine N-acyltransferase